MKFKNIDWIKYKVYIIIVGIVFLLLIIFGGMYLVHASSDAGKEESSYSIESRIEEVQLEEVLPETVLVDIKGAVVNPGVYRVNVDCSVQDVIYMAGGLLDNANTNVINLSKRVFDEMVIIIYTNEEIAIYKEENVVTEFVYVEVPCECPDQMNDACVIPKQEEEKTSDSIQENTLVSINKASKEELMTLNGIGESKAQAIISYRTEHGGFLDISDIMNVSGIGEAAFEKIKNQITL